MKILVFQLFLTLAVCWKSSIAGNPFNGYVYNKPQGPPFNGAVGVVQISNSVPIHQKQQQQIPPRDGYVQPQHLGPQQSVSQQLGPQQLGAQQFGTPQYGAQQSLVQPQPQSIQLPFSQQFLVPSSSSGAILTAELQVVPSKLVHEDTLVINQGLDPQNLGGVPDFNQPQEIYRRPEGNNVHTIAFAVQDASQGYNTNQQPCGPEPIIAQFNHAFARSSTDGTASRAITTCGPNNNCNTINLQPDFNRHLDFMPQSVSPVYGPTAIQYRSASFGITADGPLVRPKSRRLIEYTEIERE